MNEGVDRGAMLRPLLHQLTKKQHYIIYNKQLLFYIGVVTIVVTLINRKELFLCPETVRRSS